MSDFRCCREGGSCCKSCADALRSEVSALREEVATRRAQVESLTEANGALRERAEAAEAGWKAAQTDADALHDAVVEAEMEKAAALRERDEAREALRAVTDRMDRAGGDGYGMPECPWCHRDGNGLDENGNPLHEEECHDADCELLAARRILAGARGAGGGDR